VSLVYSVSAAAFLVYSGWRYSCYSELANRLLRCTGAH